MFDETLRDVAVQRLALKVELPEALRAQQFSLAYQPIIDMRQLGAVRLRGADPVAPPRARPRLARPSSSRRPRRRGRSSRSGAGCSRRPAGRRSIWNRKWLEPLSMSVNVSGVQLHQPGFVDDLRRILDSTGLDPSLLTLELTESVLVRHQRVEIDPRRACGRSASASRSTTSAPATRRSRTSSTSR